MARPDDLEEAQRQLRESVAEALKKMGKPPRVPRSPALAGWRVIGGKRKYYRSKAEANYARYLEWLRLRGDVLEWDHEPETFWFKGIKRGTVSYLPDFRVKFADGHLEWHEVKGWMDPKSKTKLARMAKYHPDTRVVVINYKGVRQIAGLFSKTIPGWE